MISKEKIFSNFYAIISELESGTVDLESALGISLVAKLDVYATILDDEIDPAYWGILEKYGVG